MSAPRLSPTIPAKPQERLVPRSAVVENTTHPFTWLDMDRIDPKSMENEKLDSEITTQVREMDSPITAPSSRDTISYTNINGHAGGHSTGMNALNRNDTGASLDQARSNRHLITPPEHPQFKTYKRRWFGLLQLVLLNIVVSMDWLTFAAVSKTSSSFFGVSENMINWASTGFLFAFVVAAPLTMFTLHKGPKPAILAASILILCGNWLRFVGAKTEQFAVVMTGQVLIGLAQPFVLSAPTKYSDTWFSERGRTSATALASLANPLGGALAQLLSPIWVQTGDNPDPTKIPNMVLWFTILSTIACVPSFFIPREPPTPPSASSATAKMPIMKSLKALSSDGSFYLVFIPFAIYVGFFNALSSLINQILEPYGFTEAQAGIAGALLIFVGIFAAAVISPITDRTHAYATIIKVLVPVIAVSFLAFLFAPPTRSAVAPDVILAFLGASSFALMPVALEYVVELTFPVGPEVTSTICWTAGQLLGGIFVIVMSSLKDEDGTPDKSNAYPPGNLQRALIFQAIICGLAAILPMGLGLKMLGLGGDRRKRMIAADSRGQRLGPGRA